MLQNDIFTLYVEIVRGIMWSLFGVLAFLSVFESVFAQNQNETSQNQTRDDLARSGAALSGNLTASFSVSDADLRLDVPDVNNNMSDKRQAGGQIEKRTNLIELNINGSEPTTKSDAFRPSPQLETYFEFNKFPVKPAYPEAKTIRNYESAVSDGKHSFVKGEVLPADNENYRNIDGYRPSGLSNFATTKNYQNFGVQMSQGPVSTGSENGPWTARVRFPTGPSTSTKPYHFEGTSTNAKPNCHQDSHVPTVVHNSNQYSPPYGQTRNKEYLPPVETSTLHHHVSTNEYLPPIMKNVPKEEYLPPIPSFSSSGKGEADPRHRYTPSFSSSGPSGGGRFNFNKLEEVPQKHFSGGFNPYPLNDKTYETSYNLMEKPSYEAHRTYGGGYANPWKKILKLFATFIPIGLLISALTPTVITVTNVTDDTTTIPPDMQSTRYRSSDDPKQELQHHILSSLEYFDKLNENGCEYRVFCELLVTARHMPDSERHVQNLLDNFAKQETDYKSRAEELKKVFGAVRNHDCNPISCEFIKNPT